MNMEAKRSTFFKSKFVKELLLLASTVKSQLVNHIDGLTSANFATSDSYDFNDLANIIDNNPTTVQKNGMNNENDWIRIDLTTSLQVKSIYILTDSYEYENKESCANAGCNPPFTNLTPCPVNECQSAYNCYIHCDEECRNFIKVYIGDSTTYNDASTTLCGEASLDYYSAARGVISCNRS